MGFLAAVVAPATAEPSFEKDVQPLLKRHCWHCHGEEPKLRGGVDLRLRRFMDKELDGGGHVIVAGEPAKSELLTLVKSGEMPEKGSKLSPEEIAILERWIAAGAKTERAEPESLTPGPFITEEDRSFWAFQPIARPQTPPAESGARIRTPVDAFIFAKLKPAGLDFAPDTDRVTRIRRVWLDLLGIPPTPEEVDAFVADTDPAAYEMMIDRALASPLYGERWGRHWLDAAGYADTNGGTDTDSKRPHAWHYRDYVVKAFNDDKPWTNFITEQLAGDELAKLTHESTRGVLPDRAAIPLLAATGFLRMAPDPTGDGADNPLTRNQVIADTVQIVTSSLLGMTVACAQCHDHRYDPITHTDYHRLRAIFEPALDWKAWRNPAMRLVSLYTAEERATADAIEAEAKKIEEEARALSAKHKDRIFEARLAKLPEGERQQYRDARAAKDKRTPEQNQLFKDKPELNVDAGSLDLFDPAADKEVKAVKAKANEHRTKKPAEQFVAGLLETSTPPPQTFLFNRGDYDQPKAQVPPGELGIIADAPEIATDDPALPTSGRRLAYARWLTSGKHPLVARVIVNRVWHHHFGRGIVGTPGDFGRLGERPSHPELLDWLAAEFMDGGWKMKRLHKLILLSTAYRQASVNPASKSADPDNRLLARFPIRRLDAETVRDSMLAVTGRMNPAAGGPPEPVGIDKLGRIVVGDQGRNANGEPLDIVRIGGRELRRSIYVEVRRRSPHTMLDTFDAPVLSPNCNSRAVTTVAPQSLLLLNDPFVVEQSEALAAQLRTLAAERRDRVILGWRRLFSRVPREEEITMALDFWNSQIALQPAISKDPSLAAAASLWQVLLGSNRFLYLD
ncbi:MAG: hypothetical protein RL088_1764 [Verrucomicrobiota bacterium]